MSTPGVAGIAGVPAQGQPAPAAQLTSLYSPLTQLARRPPWFRSNRARQRLAIFAIFSLVPTAVFWSWYLLQGRHGIHHDFHNLSFAMPVTSLWITFGPLLMQHGEFGLEKLVMSLNATASAGRWNLGAIQKAIDRADRLFYWITVPITAAAVASVWLGRATIASAVNITGWPAQIGGMVVILAVGFTTAAGMWGCFKALTITRAATSSAVASWMPFRARQPSGVQALHEFCWSTALIFSAGSTSLPTLFVVQAHLPGAARAIVLVFIAILGAGGLLLFTVPIGWLRKLGGAQKDQVLDSLAAPLEDIHNAVLHPDKYSADELTKRSSVLDMTLKLRREISAANPVPLPQLVTRGASTLALPLMLTALQIVVTKAI
jgi:hypothetical protein